MNREHNLRKKRMIFSTNQNIKYLTRHFKLNHEKVTFEHILEVSETVWMQLSETRAYQMEKLASSKDSVCKCTCHILSVIAL